MQEKDYLKPPGELRPGETMCFHVEDGHVGIWDWDPEVFEYGLIEHFQDSYDLDIIYEEELEQYDDGEGCTAVYTSAWYDTMPSYIDYWHGRIPAEVFLVAGEVLRVERMV